MLGEEAIGGMEGEAAASMTRRATSMQEKVVSEVEGRTKNKKRHGVAIR